MKRLPVRHHDVNEWMRLASETVTELQEGKVASNSTTTLTASAATTVITDYRVGKDSLILFMPTTANAAAELYGATMHVSAIAPRSNQFTITHANNSQTDRIFKYVVLGQTLN